MKTSNRFVFISGIDDVEKVSSVHPAVNQMEYQVEVPELAPSSQTHLVIVYPEAVVGINNLRLPFALP